jgi:3-oxoacyl-[acyl-carrier-protein] synthase-1
MNRLGPCGVTAWSWVSALGKVHSSDPDVDLSGTLSQSPLTKHEDLLGIPGYSGRYPDELPPLPQQHQHRDSRCARLLWECLEPLRAQVDEVRARVGADRVALVLGSSTGGIDATEQALKYEKEHGHFPEQYSFVDVHPYNSLLGLVTDALNLTGPAVVVSTACSSAGKAMASAQRLIHTGVVDAALVGGADALCELTVRGFSGLGVLSDDPCTPFDKARAGISIGEGAALLLIEGGSSAPIALLSAGESSDAHHATAPHPEGVGAEIAMRAALEIAGLEPSDVDYLNAHGTGTDKNDAMETMAISRVLGPHVSFSSTKNKTGHQLGTAGGTEAIFCVQAVSEGRAPQNIAPKLWDPDLAARPSDGTARPVSTALSNSFAFGGSNVSVAIGRKKSDVERVAPLWTPEYQSAKEFAAGPSVVSIEKPPALLLPARARGRASLLTRIFAELYGQLFPAEIGKKQEPEARTPTIYSSAFGEMDTTLKLLEQMDEDPRLSPIRFQASVHNTASGRISLETKNRAFSTALAAGQESFAMALLEAQAWLTAHGGEMCVFAAEEPLADRLKTGLAFPPLGVGLRLSAKRDDESIAELSPMTRQDRSQDVPDTPALHPFRDAPPVWGLSLLDALTKESSGPVSVAPAWSVNVSY